MKLISILVTSNSLNSIFIFDTITVTSCIPKTSIYQQNLIFTEHSIGSLSNFGIMYSSYVIALIMKKRMHVCLYVSLRVCNFVLNLILMTSGYIS